MHDVQVTDYLTWEYCTDPDIQYLNCPAPEPVAKHLPQWFKDQKASSLDINFVDNKQTVRNCLGFRGLASVGYTIPLPETLDGFDTYFSRGRLHPAMLYGTQWANRTADGTAWSRDDASEYEYRLKLLSWPWRARMSPGWRMLILPYLMDWSSDWNEFAGTVEPNYVIARDGCGVGHALKWTQPIDHDMNYYNLETVIAFKRSITVKKGTLTFCAVPIYDPDLLDKPNKTW
jgi:hypothetical protein